MTETGLQIIDAEMARQFPDAARTFADQAGAAAEAAAQIRRAGRLHLLGIGGSHWVNRLTEPFYRQAGIDATAHVISEYMRAPLPGPAVRLLTSQSGASGEILRYLDLFTHGPFVGLTLDGDSPLARRVPCLAGHGPAERSYAATRSVAITIAQHAAILQALGLALPGLADALARPAPLPDTAAATDLLAGAGRAVFCARGALQGLADSLALTFMELARVPAMGLEAGMFRHGPFEMVDARTATIFLRGQGPEGDNLDALVRDLVDAGFRPIVLDVSGQPPLPGALGLAVPPATGLAGALRLLPLGQRMAVDAAARIVPDMGTPLRSTKITSGEAA
ncbi:SIS domain-containing protein [Marinibacterium sp. SX1]|uniref:SIS domain-containing protein n=1 Tax=Marinibacterium sp. SX1 TaxID=3388424 RepID=UPI003D1767D4